MRPSKALFLGGFLAILTTTASVGCTQPAATPAGEETAPVPELATPVREATERLLFERHHPISGDWHVSPDHKRAAYVAMSGDGRFIVVDDKEGKHYDSVQNVVFSPDSQRVVYIAESGGKKFAVVDGVEGERYQYVYSLRFSPDSRRVAYAAGEGNKTSAVRFIVVDGVEGRAYRRVSGVKFSQNSQRLAYLAEKDGHWVAVIDGIESEHEVDSASFTQNPRVAFSPDSQRVAYVALRGGKHFAVIDGNEGKQYDWIYGITFSPDSQRVAYLARSGNMEFAVINGMETTKRKNNLPPSYIPPFFSQDGTYLTYQAPKGYVVTDGIKEELLDANTYFSPDRQKIVRVITKTKSPAIISFFKVLAGSPVSEDYVVIVDGRKGKVYDDVRDVVFSPDSRRVAYVADSDMSDFKQKYVVVVDGRERKQYDEIGRPVFSSNSKWLAYTAKVGKKAVIVVNGVEGQQYEIIFAGVVPSGVAADPYWPGFIYRTYGSFEGGTLFESPNSLHYLAVRGNSLYLVEEKLE